ncbi:MAG: xanthine dehydrogenase family protein molybdopterin-binding subunit [Fimbriimonadales bacterium]
MSQQTPQWPNPAKSKYLGKNIPRVDGPAKVTGAAKYTFDIVLPGMLYGKILRAPIASGSVKSIDVSAAEQMPGVRAVIPDLGRAVRFAGQEIAAVAADTEEIARDAINAIKVEWEKTPHVSNTHAGLTVPDRQRPGREASRGEPLETIWPTAAAVVEGEYYVPVREHLCLETHGVVVRWDSADTVTVWCSTQSVHDAAGEIAGALRIPKQNVTLICEYMGGGFGGKFSAGIEGMTAARLAKMAGKPVKLMLERYDEMVASGNGPDAHMKCKAAMAADGKMLGVEAQLSGTSGFGGGWGVPFPYIYDVPNVSVKTTSISTNAGSSRSLRAPGHPQASFLMETVVDELAVKLNLDPLEVRKLNTSGIRRNQLDLGAQMIGWNRRSKGKATGRIRRGIGCASAVWGGGGGPSSTCVLRIGQDGSVWAGMGTQDLGTGTRTLVAAIVAEEFSIDITKVKADIGKSSLPLAGGSGGSVTAASISPPVKMAAFQARQKLSELAANQLGIAAHEVVFKDGKVGNADGTKSVTFERLCSKLPPGGLEETGNFNRDLQQGGVAGAQFVEVEVDMWTGNVTPIKVVAVQDCGFWLNKLAAESQLIGGVIQGLSMGLLEDRKMDEATGRQLNPNMETYKVLGCMEVPEIVPVLFATHEKVTGIGEPACIPTAAAFANAVYDATGIRVRRLPITPKRLFDAKEGRR